MSTATYSGTVKTIRMDKGFGFIAMPDSADVFFHISGCDRSLEFSEQLVEQRVQFSLVTSGKGPKAINVRAAR